MVGQITITVSQAKELIAQAVLTLPEVQAAQAKGRLLFKSGTTVAAIVARLGGPQLRLGGRIAPGGARAAQQYSSAPFIVVHEQGAWQTADHSLAEEILTAGRQDVFITGANAIDSSGAAALLAGVESGSTAGKALGTLYAEGITTIIASSLEKLIPGSILDACRAAGRRRIDKAMGMAVGLLPIVGKLITEKEALEILTGVKATVIAAGGLFGAEGATTLVVEGSEDQVEKVFQLIKAAEACHLHCDPASLPSCSSGGYYCQAHLACIDRPR